MRAYSEYQKYLLLTLMFSYFKLKHLMLAYEACCIMRSTEFCNLFACVYGHSEIITYTALFR